MFQDKIKYEWKDTLNVECFSFFCTLKYTRIEVRSAQCLSRFTETNKIDQCEQQGAAHLDRTAIEKIGRKSSLF